MFKRFSHIEGMLEETEILFATKFDYFFPLAARSGLCLLPNSPDTVSALRRLGKAMGTPSKTETSRGDSSIPAIFTYLGQFIDHDITARTDRDSAVTFLGRNEPVTPLCPDDVVEKLQNGRRPQLDLDSVFGEGPAFTGRGENETNSTRLKAESESQVLYDAGFRLNAFCNNGRRDVPRGAGRTAIIPDARNDENFNVSQLQAAFILFYNQVYDAQVTLADARAKHIRARQLTRWAYQYIVVNDYLTTVCDPHVVGDTMANGPRFFGSTAGRANVFMPLEFSTAAFRFGHAMIRPSYNLNGLTQNVGLMTILSPSRNDFFFDANSPDPEQIKQDAVIDFEFFARGGQHLQCARKLNSQIAQGLEELPERIGDPVLEHLAISNLLRAYNLSIPTAQAMCDGFGLVPLGAEELTRGELPEITQILEANYFDHRTPLWYYILREAAVQQGGERLGELGSRLVCETIIGMLKGDPNSYLNNQHDPAVTSNGIEVKSGDVIADLVDILNFAQVANIQKQQPSAYVAP